MTSFKLEKMKIKMRYIGIAVLTVFAIYIFLAQIIGGSRERELYSHFNSSDIHGELKYVKIRYHLCVFKINGVEDEYFFDPVTSVLNNNSVFENTAKEGDTIIKKAFSDILELRKENGEIYVYKFRKFDE